MSWKRNAALGLTAGTLAVGGFAAAQGLAQARQAPTAVVRFQVGYFDAKGRFVPTAGRGATNVDRNAILLFLFSGPIDMGPNRRAQVPLTLDEQARLAQQQSGGGSTAYEPGVIPRKKSTDPAAYLVATGSVNQTSVDIAAPQVGGTATQAPGQFFKMMKPHTNQVIPNRLLFNPRYTISTFNQPDQVDYNPQGLEASSLYSVSIDGGSKPVDPFTIVRNLDGDGLSEPFSTTFTTTTRYIQDYNPPRFLATSPTDGSAAVQSDADIELTFSEPMDIGSFVTPRFQGDDAWTVNARYTTAPINGAAFQGKNLLLQVRVKPQTGGNVIQLRPLQGFGKGPSEFEVIVRNGVTDLSGNQIVRQIQITFKTLFNTNADVAGTVVENFDQTNFRDATITPTGDNILADWNPAAKPGFLTTTVATRTFNAQGPAPNLTPGFGVNLWGVSAIHWQNLYPVADMGGRARTITGFDWLLSSGTYFGYSYPNTICQMGHATDLIQVGGFPGNGTTAPGPLATNFRSTPILNVPTYTYSSVTTPVPNLGGYIKGPTFIRNFNSNGQNAVILDLQHGGATGATANTQERWVLDPNYVLQTCTFNNTSVGVVQAQPWYCSTRFSYLTPGAEARSTFYDIGREDIRVLPQQIVPTSQPQGTSVTFTWQGAKSDPVNPTSPDLTTLTPFVQDVRQLTGYRFIKFHAVMTNNLTNKTVPAIDSLTIPFTYK